MKPKILLFAALAALAAEPAAAKIVALNVETTTLFAAPGEMAKVGDKGKVRLIYDDAAIDPATHRVKLLNQQHWIMGKWTPTKADYSEHGMPMDDAWLDMSAQPYRYHLTAKVTHGKPIAVEVNAADRTITIRSQSDPTTIFEQDRYVIDPHPESGPDITAAAQP